MALKSTYLGISPFHLINTQTAAACSAPSFRDASLQMLEPDVAGAVSDPFCPLAMLTQGTYCQGAKNLARTQRGHNISDPTHSFFAASSFFAVHTQTWQPSLKMRRERRKIPSEEGKFGQKALFFSSIESMSK